ncbi:NAD(P)-dependent oxidoreductase [Mesorhizobium sp. BAC0120]|uniref:NAD-dependent epimerase/dehydratase family protein n=1 Tax=Mesorhizobium sp. BAC0120 TaxID=3090670 RepID=UPI00298D289E|nr:NAD(P)-dependent oxidoreductase [Mesorhizobium sp. BAC0120]MDW6026552.1 NAD(P)-dependent oxidoreductase [Mesorhizobium sp. BAC0120]
MTYLVTGATGFIGTNIVEQLVGMGEKVVALSNVAPSRRQERLAEQGDLAYVRGDVRDQAALESVIERHGVQRMIHAAVITSNAERERKNGPLIVDVNLVGAAAAATAAANKGLERFVLVGSAGVFSAHDLPDGMLVEETQPQRVDTLYGIGKSAAEVIVSRICSLNGLPYVIGRVATAFGPWEHDSGYRDTLSPIYQLTGKARSGETAVLLRDKKSNWHYGRDAAAALITLARNAGEPRFRDYNLGPQSVWPLSQWCIRLADRFPGFRFEIGEPGNIELYGANDGGVLSGSRFADEFGPPARFGVDAAFSDFIEWLEGERQ